MNGFPLADPQIFSSARKEEKPPCKLFIRLSRALPYIELCIESNHVCRNAECFIADDRPWKYAFNSSTMWWSPGWVRDHMQEVRSTWSYPLSSFLPFVFLSPALTSVVHLHSHDTWQQANGPSPTSPAWQDLRNTIRRQGRWLYGEREEENW